MAVSGDPVQSGLVMTLGRPGGNLTGVTFVSSDLAAKRLQILREIAPAISRIGVLWNPDHVDPEYRESQGAGRSLGVEIHSLEVRGPGDFDRAFRAAVAARVEAIVVVSSRLLIRAFDDLDDAMRRDVLRDPRSDHRQGDGRGRFLDPPASLHPSPDSGLSPSSLRGGSAGLGSDMAAPSRTRRLFSHVLVAGEYCRWLYC